MSEDHAFPIVVGGTGGSGTRAVVSFLAACGVHMGERTAEAGDARAFMPVLEAHIDAIVGPVRSLDYDPEDLDPDLRASVTAAIAAAAAAHRGDSTGAWGFKNPRQAFILPFLATIFPKMRFIHVVRDGRDAVLSKNRRQARKHSQALLGRPFSGTDDDVAYFWACSNRDVHAFGARRLGASYIVARIEDLCGSDRSHHVADLAGRLGIGTSLALAHLDAFGWQPSFGRGERSPPSLSPEIANELERTRSLLGYR